MSDVHRDRERSKGQPELINQAKVLGAKAWIIKPFKAPLLVAAVQKLAA
jgi:AmiR/NasT family two-component response regulator